MLEVGEIENMSWKASEVRQLSLFKGSHWCRFGPSELSGANERSAARCQLLFMNAELTMPDVK